MGKGRTIQPIKQWLLWRWAARSVVRQKNRSLMCLLTIAAGVFCLLLFEGFNKGALWEYQERVIHTRVGHLQISKKVDETTLSTDTAASLIDDSAELEKIVKEMPHVRDVFPRVRLSGLIVGENRTLPTVIEGIDPQRENLFFDKLDYLTGAALNVNEPDGIIVGEGIAKGLHISVGSKVTLLANTLAGSLNGLDLIVVGTFRSGVKEFDESFVRMNLKNAQGLLQTKGISMLSIGLDASDRTASVQKQIRAVLPENLEIKDFMELDDVYYGNSVRWLKAQFFFIRLIIYIVVIMGILNTVNITVHERTSEIGTMRAMGFGKRLILIQFLREYFILGVAGAAVGTFLAILAKYALFMGVPMPASPGATKGLNVFLRIGFLDIFLNSIAAVLCAFIATYGPAKRAASMPIIESLARRA